MAEESPDSEFDNYNTGIVLEELRIPVTVPMPSPQQFRSALIAVTGSTDTLGYRSVVAHLLQNKSFNTTAREVGESENKVTRTYNQTISRLVRLLVFQDDGQDPTQRISARFGIIGGDPSGADYAKTLQYFNRFLQDNFPVPTVSGARRDAVLAQISMVTAFFIHGKSFYKIAFEHGQTSPQSSQAFVRFITTFETFVLKVAEKSFLDTIGLQMVRKMQELQRQIRIEILSFILAVPLSYIDSPEAVSRAITEFGLEEAANIQKEITAATSSTETRRAESRLAKLPFQLRSLDDCLVKGLSPGQVHTNIKRDYPKTQTTREDILVTTDMDGSMVWKLRASLIRAHEQAKG